MKSLTKEAAAYEKEAVAQEAKIATMREAGRDIYDIKKQEEVLQESYMMIPDSKGRLQAALEDLQAFLVRLGFGFWGGGGGGKEWSGWVSTCFVLSCKERRRGACLRPSTFSFSHTHSQQHPHHSHTCTCTAQAESGEVKEVQASEFFAEANALVGQAVPDAGS